jgi:hypothetical protein
VPAERLISPPHASPESFGGLLHKATVWALFLAVSLTLNARVNTSQNPSAQGREQKSDLVLDSIQQADHGASPATGTKLELADGTPVRLRFVRAVVSSRVLAGEKVPLDIVEPVLVGSLIAIPQHSPAAATVTMAQAERSMGRGGNLQLKIESVRLADGELVPVRAVKDVKGGGRQPMVLAGTAAGVAYWPASPLVFLVYVKGKSAAIPAGAEITAYTTGDILLDPSKFRAVSASPQGENAPN